MEVKRVPVDSLRPHPLNEKLYPPNEEEDRELENSIDKYGILDRLVATPEGVIIHGARRWRIAKKLGIKEVECEFREFEDPEIALIEFNRYRKKTPRIIKNEYDFLKEKLAPKAKERQRLTQFAGKDEAGKPITKKEIFGGAKFGTTETEEEKESKGKVRYEAAEKIGVSSGQLQKIDYIYEHEFIPAVKPIVEKLDRGEISVHQAYKKIKSMLEPEPPKEEEEKFWKCDGCGKKFSEFEPVAPTKYILCPNCLVDFNTWKVQKFYDSDDITE